MCHISMKVNDDDKLKKIPWDLILKALKNAANQEEKNQLGVWIEANDQHGRLWNELQQAWDEICKLNSGFNPDVVHAWQQVVEKTKKRYGKSKRIMPVYWRAAAACILILMGVALGALFKTSTTSPVTWTQYETQYGKSFVTLPDGTQVWLNTRTTLKFSNRFNEKERQVEVNGEALFDVTHHPDIPFLVDTKDMQIRVHGTKFNVQAYDNKSQTSVSLIEGSVTLAVTGCPKTRLEPGSVAIYDRPGKTLAVNPCDPLATLWASNELRIEDKSLSETARLLESWYRIGFEVAPALKSSHYYTLTVRHESPAELLAVMQKIGKFQYKIEEQRITIY